jgi:hypothetical protein
MATRDRVLARYREVPAVRANQSRELVLARYRDLRAASVEHHSKVLKFLSRSAINRSARHLGLLIGGTMIAESDEELTLIFDLALYTPEAGRSSAFDRYERAERLTPGSDAELVLAALRRTEFSLWRIERRHETAGLVVFDLLREREAWLVDQGLEISGPIGMIFAARLAAPGDFRMTTGVIVPVDELMFSDLVADDRAWRHETPHAVAADPWFARTVYRAAVENGVMEAVRFA